MILLFLTFFLLIIVGVPIAVSMGISVMAYFLLNDISMNLFIQQVASGASSFPLLAIPYFILAGIILGAGGAAKRLIDFANSIVGFMWGGLAQVSIVGSMFLAGVTGSSVADAASIGAILIPEMKRKGYPTGFNVAVNAVSSTIGIIIPPSIPMITYAWISGGSIGKMFLAGIIPGILAGLAQLTVAYSIAKKNNFPREPKPSLQKLVNSFKESFLALLFPVIVLGGILTGLVTPTEAGVLAVAYGLLLGLVIYKDLHIRDLPGLLIDAIKATSVIMLILGTATAFSWILSYERVPMMIIDWFASLGLGRVAFLIFTILFCLFIGTFIGGTSAALIVVAPIFLPVAKNFGIDPIQYGLLLIATLAIGLFTPPVGTTLFISCRIGNISILDGFKSCLPFLVLMLGVLLLIAFVPSLTLTLAGMSL
jgi:C4-dicarboxylate transporter DctM subunit